MAGPLDGVRVLEVGQALAGPLAGMILADLGADVLKVERPGGGDDARLWGPPFVGDTSLLFLSINRNKRGITIDLKSDAGRAKLRELAADVDVLIQNLRPGVVESLGIGPGDMETLNPRLIYCSISAFGDAGPLKARPGFDPLLQAYGGVMSLTGGPDTPDTFCAPPINDKATALWSVIGIQAALAERERTGKGRTVDTSLFETAVFWVDNQLNAFLETGNVPVKHGTGSANLVPYQVFETADRPICIAAGNDRLFHAFAREVGHPEWSADERFSGGRARTANREALVPLIREVMLTDTRSSWIERFEAAGVPCSEVNSVPELAASEQLDAAGMIMPLAGSGHRVMAMPLKIGGERFAARMPAPERGEPEV